MGVIVILYLAAGAAMGFILSVLTGGPGLVLAVRGTRDRQRDGWIFAGVFSLLFILLVVGVCHYPYAPIRPGADSEVIVNNAFLMGLGYASCPGLALLIAGISVWFAPRKRESPIPLRKG